MTLEERQMLQRAVEISEKMDQAFFQRAADGSPPMIDRIGVVVVGVERGSWVGKWTFRIVVAAGALMGAVITIRNGLQK